MDFALALRTTLLAAASGLAACAAPSGDKGDGAIGSTCAMLISRTSPTLALITQDTRPPAAPNANDVVVKVVSSDGMRALIATFESEQMFPYALASTPAGSRQSLQLDRGDDRAVWVFTGDAADERRAAFVKARNYFLQLFNYARNYNPDDAAKRDMQESRKLEAERNRRRA